MDNPESRKRRQKAQELIRAGRLNEARAILNAVCQRNPRDAENWGLLGAIEGQLGAYDAAITCLKRAIAIFPRSADAHFNLAQAHMHVQDYEAAVRAYRQFLKLNPSNVEARNAYALALDYTGRFEEAVREFRMVLGQQPRNADAWYNLASTYLSVGDDAQALSALRTAIDINPAFIKPRVMLAFHLIGSDEFDAAREQLDAIRRIDPSHRDPIYGEIEIRERQGNLDGAWELLRPQFETGAEDKRFFHALSKLAGHAGVRREAAERMESAIARRLFGPADAVSLHFALGNIYDSMRDADRAFRHFSEANVLSTGRSEDESFIEKMEQARRVFTEKFFERAPRSRTDSGRAVFIVGMPRSGTTLAEQILQCHPLVHAGGELADIFLAVNALKDRCAGRFPDCLVSADPAILDEGANRYLRKLFTLSADARLVTDKMPHNFMDLGVIALLFPKARVIHCCRDALDTCFSIFTQSFSTVHGYARDQRKLGQHYRAYVQLMAHWRRVLPLPIFDLQYEELVTDQERVTRHLLDFLDLPFDPRCLRFHETGRIASTISYDQVRQPLYRKSVGRWRPYAQYLRPLMDALAIVPDENRD